MAATTAGAVKAYLERQGFGISFFRDRAPDGQALPYGTINEAVATVPDPSGPKFDKDTAAPVIEHVQVDLWQRWRDLTATPPRVIEDYTLAPLVVRSLNGCQLPDAPTRVWGVVVINAIRLLEVDNNVVHHPITVAVYRDL